ncbi:uncharacterized protein Z519_12140 [Cladophialophora bantiana CBS 173.52]|uniref:Heterokaryon incompatibility domain-containing protein n=1 Tax=Cladophialophora bantiana (strain ATCC 10958 / CBS 173.52 / CDC B-1940 / NIH 8579) TaxID=1442370 RepID=A0A0D2FKL9_CLAB1|nr:uncharacterized protein Z519_12140 [Cladophialophora bantiana CBS 173.52]KIW87237.1 hypothetical protein Z519_12140 [Cladophialophora bantiana CBS 173.52]
MALTFGLYSHYDLDVRISVERNGKDPEILFPSWLGKPGSYLIEPSADTSSSLALALLWIAECINNHTECAVSPRTRFPRSLINIGQEPIGIVPTNNLHSLGEDAHYVALSHYWGGPGSILPPKLTMKTLATVEQGIPDSDLPPTFLDAVRTTRALSFRYLWIDSLCIVQDDRTNFEIECANKNSIYSNADLTIAASDAMSRTHRCP